MPSHADDPVPIDSESNRLGFSPRVFALCQTFSEEDGKSEEGRGESEEGRGESRAVEELATVVVAWGMTLPGGKAMAISPDRALSVTSSPESMAWLHGADLVWAVAD